MSLRKGHFIKTLLATLLLIIAIPIAIFFSGVIFQGHMHPDAWGYIWQDRLVITTFVIIYILYICKVIWKREGKFKNL